MPIEIKITGADACEVFAHLHALAGKNAPAAPAVEVKGNVPVVVPSAPAEPVTAEIIIPAAPSEDAPPLPVDPDTGLGETQPRVDTAGVAFDDTLHTGTLKKDGTWRMKKGAEAPAAPVAADAPPAPPVDADDEFAAFASAPVEPAAPVARKWSDADLSKLCNQGASKDGNPDRVKVIIAKYVPANEVSHSRNIPAADREAFASEVEAALGIQYAG